MSDFRLFIALACALLTGCSDAQCRGAHGLLALVCGGQGDDPPDPVDAGPTCDLTQQAPAVFALLNDPSKPLEALRSTVTDLADFQCLDASRPTCSSDGDCSGVLCSGGVCACRISYSPLGELLRAGLRGLTAAAREPPESAAQRCVSIEEAASLPQPNHICEVKRAWQVLQGTRSLLTDPRLASILRAGADYASGKTDGIAHASLPGTLGRMAKSCDPSFIFTLLDKFLLFLTPELAQHSTDVLRDLINDPTLRPMLLTLASGDHAAGRESVIYLVHYFITQVSAVSTGSEAAKDLQDILDKLVYPEISDDALKAHIQAAVDLLDRALADDVGAFPALQGIILCAAAPEVDVDPVTGTSGELVGSVYDLLTLPAAQGIDLGTLLDLMHTVVAIDQHGQLQRAARGVVVAVEGDDAAMDAVRGAVAEAFCGHGEVCDGLAFARGMLPSLALLFDRGAMPDLLTLADDLLDGCPR